MPGPWHLLQQRELRDPLIAACSALSGAVRSTRADATPQRPAVTAGRCEGLPRDVTADRWQAVNAVVINQLLGVGDTLCGTTL